jgi:AraC-like DNA-binding protein
VLYDSVTAIAVQMLRQLAGRAGEPVEVLIGHDMPKDPSAYSRLLRRPVRFNERRNCVMLRREALRVPLASADPVARAEILARLQQMGRWSSSDWADRVRHELRREMCAGQPRMPAVAERLQVGVRTLRRKLALEGTTFESLRDEVGYAVAREMIELTDLPISDIAAAIGFASPSVFSESFLRWSGMAPSRWRKRQAGRFPAAD